MDDTTSSIEERAARLAALCIRHGAASEGEPAVRVGELYEQLCAALGQVSSEYGADCMLTSADLTEAAIDNGLIYVGEETLSFVSSIGERVRAAHRHLVEPHERF